MVESGDGIGIQPRELAKVGTGTVYPIPHGRKSQRLRYGRDHRVQHLLRSTRRRIIRHLLRIRITTTKYGTKSSAEKRRAFFFIKMKGMKYEMNAILKSKSTRLLSALLAVLMIVAMLPTSAFAWSAEEGTNAPPPTVISISALTETTTTAKLATLSSTMMTEASMFLITAAVLPGIST